MQLYSVQISFWSWHGISFSVLNSLQARHNNIAITSGVNEMPLLNFSGVSVGLILKHSFGLTCRQP
jgi:hypothetical protein